MSEPSSAPQGSLIHQKILVLRNQRVMLDSDLAELYDVETRILVQAIRRNIGRFPEDFMFQAQNQELAALRSQIVISNTGRGGRRTAPYVFTEQGVAMLSSVLNSPRAISINIEIMRTFVRMRELANSNGEVAKRLDELEARTEALALRQDKLAHHTRGQIKQVFDALRELMTPPDPPKRPIGFVTEEILGKPKAIRLKNRATGTEVQDA